MANSARLLYLATLVPYISTFTVPNDDYCVKSKCDYEAMWKSGNDRPVLAPVDWESSTVVRACSCTTHCAFYGDCCLDSLEFSRKYLLDMLRLSHWSEVIQLRSTLKPTCLELFIEGDHDGDDDKSINIQMAAECDNSCYIDDLTHYEGSRGDEIIQRLPVYHEGLGLVFYNEKCVRRCYGKVLEKAKLKPLPFTAVCNGMIDLQSSANDSERNVTCRYELNITQVESLLAHCLPMTEDVFMQQAMVCDGFNMTGRSFVSCDKDSPSGTASSLLRYRESIYKICINSSQQLALQCGQSLPEDGTNVSFIEEPLKTQLTKARCVPEGGKIGLEWPKFHMLGSESFVRKLQDSDFSYRYMFDVFKLAEAEDNLQNYLLTNSCRIDINEIFIERWGICVKRKVTPLLLIVRSSPSKGGDWLDFGPNFFQIRRVNSLNGSSNTILELANDPAFKLEASCFQYDFFTSHVLVLDSCLCTTFRKLHDDRSQHRQFIPREDDNLSFAGSLSICISLVFLSAAITIPAFCSKLRNRATKMIMLLSAYLSIGMIMVLINIYWNLSVARPRYKNKQTYEDLCLLEPVWQEIACTSIGATLHFTYLATFCLALALYVDLWRSVRNCFHKTNHSIQFLVLAGVSSAIPLCIVAAAVLLDLLAPESEIAPRYSEFVCWITEPKALIVFFIGPVVLVFIADICVLALIARQIRANTFVSRYGTTTSFLSTSSSEPKNTESRSTNQRSKFRIYVKMALTMGLTWMVGCLAPLMPKSYGISTVFWYGFVVFNGLQGVFIFYANVFNNKTMQELRTKMNRSSSTWLAGQDRMFGNIYRYQPRMLTSPEATDSNGRRSPMMVELGQ